MTELKVFHPRLSQPQASTFDFNRASRALITSLRRRLANSGGQPSSTTFAEVLSGTRTDERSEVTFTLDGLGSEWRDPVSVRLVSWDCSFAPAAAVASNAATFVLTSSVAA